MIVEVTPALRMLFGCSVKAVNLLNGYSFSSLELIIELKDTEGVVKNSLPDCDVVILAKTEAKKWQVDFLWLPWLAVSTALSGLLAPCTKASIKQGKARTILSLFWLWLTTDEPLLDPTQIIWSLSMIKGIVWVHNVFIMLGNLDKLDNNIHAKSPKTEDGLTM